MGPKVANKPRKGDEYMKQMGLLTNVEDSGDDDDDLEAELLRIQNEGRSLSSSVKPRAKKAPNLSMLERMADDIQLEIGSDEELSGDEEDLMKELECLSSADDDDEEEEEKPKLDSVTLLNLLTNRLDLYKSSLNNVPDSKKKRYERAIKTLNDQIKAVKSGKAIDESEIPPEISKSEANPVKPVETLPQPKPETTPALAVSLEVQIPPGLIESTLPVSQNTESISVLSTEDTRLIMLRERRQLYHNAAISAKQSGDEANSRKYLKIRKDFDNVIQAILDGKDVDLSNVPPPPPTSTQSLQQNTSQLIEKPQASSPTKTVLTVPQSKPESGNQVSSHSAALNESNGSAVNNDAPNPIKAPAAADAPVVPPKDVLSNLEQRQKKFQEAEQEASQQGNSSKARRMGRIVKQYQDAIKATKQRRPFDFSELPTPPGFEDYPLPGGSAPPPKEDESKQSSAETDHPAQQGPSALLNNSLKAPDVQRKRSTSPSAQDEAVKPKTSSIKHQASLSIQEKQLQSLMQRQSQYKKAALDAKNHDDKELALKYLRIVKGIEPMIHAATNGLPVDMSQLPPEPASEHEVGFVIIDKAEMDSISSEDRVAEFEKIITQLKEQIKRASDNASSFKKTGDVKNSAVFETLEQNCRKDLDAVNNAKIHNDPVPKYHYETRQYTTVKVNNDLGDPDLEISIIRGISFPIPSDFKSAKDLDTYVMYEIAWPQEEGQKGQTDWAKHTDNPEYNFTTKLRIDRRSKSMLRVFKNRKLKLEIYYKKGFLKSDKHMATVNIKLESLETLATVHDSYDLLDPPGRKEIGGKLEVKMRIREPLVQKQVEVIKEKWLVIDQVLRVERPMQRSPPAVGSRPNMSNTHLVDSSRTTPSYQVQSIEVLKFEKKELDAKIRDLSNRLSPSDLNKLTQKSAEMVLQIENIATMMKKNQLTAHEYVKVLLQLAETYQTNMNAATVAGDKARLLLMTTKKDIISKEIRAWKAKINIS